MAESFAKHPLALSQVLNDLETLQHGQIQMFLDVLARSNWDTQPPKSGFKVS